jgi:site-specific DNA-cytosine methylase
MKKQFLDLITGAIGVDPIFINSALVSAQNRQRYYWCNWFTFQPKDKGIVLKDILESEVESSFFHTDRAINYMQQGNEKWQQAGARRADRYTQSEDKEKSFCLTANMHKGVPYNYLEVKCAAQRGRYDDNGEIQQQFEVRKDEKTNALTTVQKDNFAIQRVATASDIKGHDYNKRIYSPNGKAPTLAAATGGNLEPKVSIDNSSKAPIRVHEFKGGGQGNRVYSKFGKSIALSSQSGGTAGAGNLLINQSECLKNIHYRKLTPRECGRLQTIPEDILDTLLSAGISNSQLYKMFGNGWTIDVIAHLFTLMQIDRML